MSTFRFVRPKRRGISPLEGSIRQTAKNLRPKKKLKPLKPLKKPKISGWVHRDKRSGKIQKTLW